MRHCIAYGLIASVAVVSPMVASAQNFRDGIESSGSDPLARRVMHDYGVCAAKGLPNYVRGMLALDPGTKAYAIASRRLADYSGRCLPRGGRLKLGGLFYAGSLAEGMLMHNAAAAGWEQRVAYDPARPAIVAHGEPEAIGACAVRAVPADARALFASEIASEAETAAIKALMPAVQACVPDGVTAKLNVPTLRALLALAAYRLSQPATPAAKTKGS